MSEGWGKIIVMHTRPFPKPPPADPLPLETWLNRVDRAEVGREPFFRGRDAEFNVFRRAASSLHDGLVGGGTMIFQGAPGAGKTALMQECLEAVRRHSTPDAPWVAVALHPGSLRFPGGVVREMVDAANAESERLREGASGIASRVLGDLLYRGRQLLQEILNPDISVGGVSWGGREREVSTSSLFAHAAPLLGKFHIVVCVDEAQNTPICDNTKSVMDCLHRDPQGIPMVAAFFGLSDTQHVLRQCGLSKFDSGRVVNMDPLPFDDSACAIRSTFDAYDFTGTQEDREAWVNELAELSQGWPQHINRVAVAAARVIRDNGGHINGALLEQALESGRKRKDAYYAGRLAAGTRSPWVYRQMAQAAREKGGVLPYDDLRQFLAEETLDDFLTNALHAGLLVQVQHLPYHYRIPIPSFEDWLRALPVEPPQA